MAVVACTFPPSDTNATNAVETLAPGAIVLADFTPRLAYMDTIDLSWSYHQADFARLDAPPKRAAAVTVIRPQAVIDETGVVSALPNDLVAWFQERGDLTIISTTPIELGSVKGTLIEATVKAHAHTNRGGAIPVACAGPITSCHHEDDDVAGAAPSLTLGQDEHALILVVTVAGDPIVVTAGTPPRTWDINKAELDAFLRSIRFPN
jgi:hypothetical protein